MTQLRWTEHPALSPSVVWQTKRQVAGTVVSSEGDGRRAQRAINIIDFLPRPRSSREFETHPVYYNTSLSGAYNIGERVCEARF